MKLFSLLMLCLVFVACEPMIKFDAEISIKANIETKNAADNEGELCATMVLKSVKNGVESNGTFTSRQCSAVVVRDGQINTNYTLNLQGKADLFKVISLKDIIYVGKSFPSSEVDNYKVTNQYIGTLTSFEEINANYLNVEMDLSFNKSSISSNVDFPAMVRICKTLSTTANERYCLTHEIPAHIVRSCDRHGNSSSKERHCLELYVKRYK